MGVSTLFLELGGVILGLAVLGRLASRIGLSPIPLYLIGGLAFGEGGVLPLVTAEEFIKPASEIGVVLLLFTLGLEYNAKELFQSLRASRAAGALDFGLNFTPGFVIALILGWSPLAAVILGGATYVSSSGIAAKIISDFGRLGNRETPTILSVLVLEDLAMAAYLPIVAALLVGGGFLGTVISLVVALTAVAVALYVSVRFGERLSAALFSRNDEVLLLSLLGLTLVIAGIADRLLVSAAVGAFLVGLAVSGQAAERAQQLFNPLKDLFAAAFFVFFGLQVNPSTIPPVFIVALILAVVTSATKITTGWMAAARAGVKPRGRLRAGMTLVPRGEFSIVIANLGVASGLEPALGPTAATYVLITAVLGPLLARLSDPIMNLIARPAAEPIPVES